MKECTRLFSTDSPWHEAIENNKPLAKSFHLDPLIQQPNPVIKRVGITMGATIMMRVPKIDLAEVVNNDYSMDKINQGLLKYVIA